MQEKKPDPRFSWLVKPFKGEFARFHVSDSLVVFSNGRNYCATETVLNAQLQLRNEICKARFFQTAHFYVE